MTIENDRRFLLIHSSQTGQAEAIAEEFCQKALEAGLHPELHCISQTEKKFWLEREKLVVIITSTTGDGDPPDKALKWWRRIKKKTLPANHLCQLEFAILGLGDSNYTNFCKCARQFNERLLHLGAKHFYPPHWADDATGLEVVVEPWMEEFLLHLKKHFGLVGSDSNNSATNRSTESNPLTPNTPTPEMNAPSTESGDSNHEASAVMSDHNAQGSTEDSPAVEESLTKSLPPLCEAALTVPLAPPPFLEVQYKAADSMTPTELHQNGHPLPSAETALQSVPVTKACILTAPDALKTTLLLQLDVSGLDWSYLPGDSIGVVCPNDANEVKALINRLGVDKQAHDVCEISILEDTKKKRARIPEHFSVGICIDYLFTHCCDIRAVPTKSFIRALVEYTADSHEKRRLQELCSKQGASHYQQYVREASICLFDLLHHFPSCNPPISTVLEHLPRLLPRPYSICSSPAHTPNLLEIVFNVVDIPPGSGRVQPKKGICTGWMQALTITQSLTDQFQQISLNETALKPVLPIYLRNQHHFRPPGDAAVPLILVGPGTGVAPFVGFLRHRSALNSNHQPSGPVWLFYGCRHKEKDFLFKEELESYANSGILSKLLVSFSRDSTQPEGMPHYVQDNLRLHGREICELMTQQNAHVCVCGDAKGMAKDVLQALTQILETHSGRSGADAAAYLMEMRLHKRYLEDVWT